MHHWIFCRAFDFLRLSIPALAAGGACIDHFFLTASRSAGGMDGNIQVIDGLSKGERIVVYSEKELKADSAIKVVTALTGSGK